MLHIPPEKFGRRAEVQSAYRHDPAEALVRSHGEMVRRIAWHVHSRVSASIELEDLVQTGLVALIEAARCYEDRGHAFSTYASMRVRGAMIDQLRREARMSRSAIAGRRRLAETRARLEQHYLRHPYSIEMAEAMGLTLSAYLELEAGSQPVEQSSIDEHYSDQDPWFADPGEGADLKIEAEQMRTILARQLADMPEREAMVLQLFFVEECNLHEIGAILGIGAPRVCQIKKAALARLRMRLSDLV
ncbi:MAG: FliA/WhiG family RNA polymerase sigma factor [Sphingomonadales bacterium]|jgi:RNA polymerase sigma factor for flagellar operon FliA|nr:FliA/WhiG family RNA polymerase sigma factor [Sphingomonadales bacterium]MBK9004788.1 FliA/WhiG family RNA polymerase sigma factor [Sphingomonadales bacterium]MBK9267485.1 FliA/WhiG family RNA polymerase sigma factor [Sphingomonadales bacterium]MBP6433230.1 FliA/WhiG family RNA polymerase sigma factor [Sphingorhabdus sp.]